MVVYEALRKHLLRLVRSDFFMVLIFGAFGGLLFWIWQTLRRGEEVETWTHLVKYVFLGAGSSVLLVFLIFNTDREDRSRFYATAVMGGLMFGVVIHGLIVGISQLLDPARELYRETLEKPRNESYPIEYSYKGDIRTGGPTWLEQIEGLAGRAGDGQRDMQTAKGLEVIDVGKGWVEVHSQEGERRVDRLVQVFERIELEIEVKPQDRFQDLTAWLFVVEGGLLRFIGSSDDAADFDPIIQRTLEPGQYMLRILPFSNEDLRPFRVRIRIVLS